jgi:hypothetical protein
MSSVNLKPYTSLIWNNTPKESQNAERVIKHLLADKELNLTTKVVEFVKEANIFQSSLMQLIVMGLGIDRKEDNSNGNINIEDKSLGMQVASTTRAPLPDPILKELSEKTKAATSIIATWIIPHLSALSVGEGISLHIVQYHPEIKAKVQISLERGAAKIVN